MVCQICGGGHSGLMHWRTGDTKASHDHKRAVRDKTFLRHGFFVRVVDVLVDKSGRLWEQIEFLEPDDEVPVQ